jgi:hypothetical protein
MALAASRDKPRESAIQSRLKKVEVNVEVEAGKKIVCENLFVELALPHLRQDFRLIRQS